MQDIQKVGFVKQSFNKFDDFYQRHYKKLSIAALLLLFCGNTANISYISGKKPKELCASAAPSGFPSSKKKNRDKRKTILLEDLTREAGSAPETSPYSTEVKKGTVYGMKATRSRSFKGKQLASESIRVDHIDEKGIRNYFKVFYDFNNKPKGYSIGKVIDGHMRPDQSGRFDVISEEYDEKQSTAKKIDNKTWITIRDYIGLPIKDLDDISKLKNDFEVHKNGD